MPRYVNREQRLAGLSYVITEQADLFTQIRSLGHYPSEEQVERYHANLAAWAELRDLTEATSRLAPGVLREGFLLADVKVYRAEHEEEAQRWYQNYIKEGDQHGEQAT